MRVRTFSRKKIFVTQKKKLFLLFLLPCVFEMMDEVCLESEEEEEGHHKTEETHGFGQSESQNGV